MDSTNTPALPANASIQAALIENNARRDLARSREQIVGQASEVRDQMARLLKQLENPNEPPQLTGALQKVADLEQLVTEFGQKRELLQTVRFLRHAMEAPSNAPTTAT